MYSWEQSYLAYRWCDLSHSRYPPQITVTVVCRSLSHDGQTSVWCPCCPCAMSAQLSPSGSKFAKSSSHDVSVVEAKRTSHCACIQLFSPEPCLSSALIFCWFEGTWAEQHRHILPWKRCCGNGLKFSDALNSDEEKINSKIK